ncbi:hypothetical protein DF183_14705 [Alcaligenes faecalis]|uniref:Uncharacterized protein n=1 Tax=Alcaligenes faecalis TaxID=511 RepID=A0A2U2BGF4_ALCFA|nr:hypothetical protein DF183_14705 [Alcaligenes faecalis]
MNVCVCPNGLSQQRNRGRGQIRMFVVCLMVPLLTSCGAIGRVTDTACLWIREIRVSQKDVLTHGTAQQILGHNREWAKNCSS